MISFTQSMFRFPYRIYQDEVNTLNEIKPISKDSKWVVGWKRIFAEDILSIADTFYLYSDIDEIIADGFEASVITTKDDIYSCEWDMKTLEKKLDEHFQKLDDVIIVEPKKRNFFSSWFD